MKKKLFNICMICFLLASCNKNQASNSISVNSNNSINSTTNNSVNSNTTSNKEVKIEVKNKKASKVYLSTSYSFDLPTTFFTFDEDVPYVNMENFINTFLTSFIGIQHYSINKNVVTNIDNNISLTLDTKNNTIYTSDLDQFQNISNMSINSSDLTNITEDSHAIYSEADSSYTKGKEITIDLNQYHTKIVSYENNIYVPFGYLDNIFFSQSNNRFAFNGEDFYNSDVNLLIDEETNSLSELGTAYFSGSLAHLTERSDSYINYCYYSFLFEMVYNDGKNNGMSVTELDKKLDDLGLKSELRSKDPSVAELAIAKTLYTAFSDGGHTRFTNLGVTTPYSKENNENATNLISSLDSRFKKLIETNKSLLAMRGELTNNLEISGETAIIRFDEFEYSKTSSTFDLFKQSFETIETNSSIKNVVFDVSLNGGGAAMALCDALSFLTDDPIKIRTKNPNTGAINVESAKFDNNQDGDFNDNDSYQGKYNFYVLTSNFSFSCANAFAVYCKDYNLAKIIGNRSGGGDCSVATGSSTSGASWTMSSTSMLIRKDNTSYDDGASLDYELNSSYFYDADKLNNYLKGLNK